MGNELKITIGGDASGFKTAAAQSATALTSLGNAAQLAGTKVQKIVPGVNQATNSLTNLGRIVQDAPFGFIGIANNINPALESFQRLKAETGSTGTALKLLGSSLLGPAGIGIGIAAVSSLITVAVQKYGSLGNAVSALLGTLSNAEKATQALGKAQEESNKQAGEEIARIQVLSEVAKDVTRSMEIRTQAAKEFQEIAKQNNVEVQREAVLNGQVAEAIDLVTASILKRARARAVESAIADLNTKRLDLELKEAEALRTLEKRQDAFNKKVAQGAKENERGFFIGIALKGVQDVQKDIKDIDEQIKEIASKVNKDQINPFEPKKLKESKDIFKDQLAILEKLREVATSEFGKLFDAADISKTATALADLERRIGAIKLLLAVKDAEKTGLPQKDIDALAQNIKNETQQKINDVFQREALLLETKVALKATSIERVEIPPNVTDTISKATGFDKKIPIPTEFELDVKFRGDEFAKAAEQAKKAAAELQAVILNSVVDTISQGAELLGQTIGSIFSGDGLGSAFAQAAQGILSIVGGVLQEVGKQIIATSILVQTLKKALASLFANPVAALGVGVGLVALGSLLKNIKFNVPKFAEGGIVTGPTLGLVGEAGKEAIIPLDKLPGLLGNVNIAGNLNVTLVPTIRFSMNDFIVGFERGNERRRRLG